MIDVVQKLWGFCHTLRHDGIDYGDYIEQITYLLFLKMADERGVSIPKGCGWPQISDKSGTALLDHYVEVLRILGKTPGILGDIYSGAQSRFNNPVNLKKLVSLIDETEWTALDVDIKAAAYEGLLEKAAAEGKKGAGGIFTPRLLIKAIVRCLKPDPRSVPDFTICDPAVGTGGFLVCAYEWLVAETKGALDRDVAKRVRTKTYYGQDLVHRPRRLALMNLYLHGIEPHIRLGDTIYEQPSGERFDVVMTNPPFGTKGANQAPEREDFTVSTSNKQLNFIQHVQTILKPGGRAAIVLPDSCLFADQAGEVFKLLTEDCNLHTVLRLPRGMFTPYSPVVKANVVFLTKGYATETVWIYDARTNVPAVTKRDRPLTAQHFAEFEQCYGGDPNGRAARRASDSKENRWQSFSIEAVKAREFKLSGFKWIKEELLEEDEDQPEPEELVTDALEDLESAVGELKQLLPLLGNDATNGHTTGNEIERALPEGWAETTLDQLLREPLRNGHSARESQTGSGVRTLTLSAVTYGDFSEKNTKLTVADPAKVRDLWLEPGDILIERSNAPDLVGTARLYQGPRAFAIFPDLVIRARLLETAVLPRFIELSLQTEASRKHLMDAAEGTAGSMPKIDQGVVLQVPVRLPPFAEQRRIVDKVEVLLASVEVVRTGVATVSRMLNAGDSRSVAARVGRLTQGILRKAFSGQLVATEADLARAEGREYEPASVLLECVRAQRAASEPIPNNGKRPRRHVVRPRTPVRQSASRRRRRRQGDTSQAMNP